MIDAKSLDVVTGYYNLPSPIKEFPFYMLIETSGSNNNHDEEKLHAFLENLMNEGTVLDGTVTNESKKMKVLYLKKLFFILSPKIFLIFKVYMGIERKNN